MFSTCEILFIYHLLSVSFDLSQIRMVNKDVDVFEQENALLTSDTFDAGSLLSIENESAQPALSVSISSQVFFRLNLYIST